MLCYVVYGRLDRLAIEGLRTTVRMLFRGIETAVLSEADEHPLSNKEIKRPRKKKRLEWLRRMVLGDVSRKDGITHLRSL